MNPQGERRTAEQVLPEGSEPPERAEQRLGERARRAEAAGGGRGGAGSASSTGGSGSGGGAGDASATGRAGGTGGPGGVAAGDAGSASGTGGRGRTGDTGSASGPGGGGTGSTSSQAAAGGTGGPGGVPAGAAGGTGSPSPSGGTGSAGATSGAGAAGTAGGGADPVAVRRRAERRGQRIAAGATELEQRLADLLRDGLATADHAGYGAWDETAARMVDAQAPGLGARVREWGAIPSSGPGWPARLLEECALTHLLNQGFLHLDSLPEELAATTRSRVGVTTPVAELLAHGQPVRDHWLVLGGQDSEDGKLTTRRIWLRGRTTGRMALLLSFGAAGRSPDPALPPGLVLDADLVYYPGTRPLRAALGTRYPPTAAAAAAEAPAAAGAPDGGGIDAALAAYGEALSADPWLEDWPVVLSGVTPVPGADGWQLADEAAGTALPVDPRCLGRTNLWQLTAISGGRPVTVFGTCGHRGITPLTTWDPEPVPLALGTRPTSYGGTR
ncbi:SWIM zinc finger family protein [Streptomyces sp. NPDC019937]|uniref:SWIM zinc finger family protein n=1 Tax=Streptomyces sp. NPDC019937 TaxID=3154787 RepID=UPI0033CB32B5